MTPPCRLALATGVGAETIGLPGWERADARKGLVRRAANGGIRQARLGADGSLEDRVLLHDFSDMEFQAIEAPYQGVPERHQS